MMKPDKEEKDLHQTMDARVWARQFLRSKRIFNWAVDEEILFGWFANAIMCGYDHGRRQAIEDYNINPLKPENSLRELRASIDKIGERLEQVETMLIPAPGPGTVTEAGASAGLLYAGEMYPDAERPDKHREFGPQEAEAQAKAQATRIKGKWPFQDVCPTCNRGR